MTSPFEVTAPMFGSLLLKVVTSVAVGWIFGIGAWAVANKNLVGIMLIAFGLYVTFLLLVTKIHVKLDQERLVVRVPPYRKHQIEVRDITGIERHPSNRLMNEFLGYGFKGRRRNRLIGGSERGATGVVINYELRGSPARLVLVLAEADDLCAALSAQRPDL